MGSLAQPAHAKIDPTVDAPHMVPTELDDAHAFGVEPGRGLRTMTSGVRVINLPGGGVLAARDRLAQPPTSTVPVPERLGGGFLFVVSSVVWRADSWLGPLRPVFTSPGGIARLFVGLDRAYVRTTYGVHVSFDPVTGHPRDLGPWPPSPFVGPYVAADGWRAVAITDLRGAVVTLDAGATWKPLALPIDPKELRTVGDTVVITGLDPLHAQAYFAVQTDGNVTRVGAPVAEAEAKAAQETRRLLGKRPLLAATEDGWPLDDGTALVARDGSLSRVRLTDGIVVEEVPDAFPMRPARCHPLALPRPGDPRAFGFVCGAPRGVTEIFAWDAQNARMRPVRHFDSPRAVTSPANGSLVIKGPCDPEATGEGSLGRQTYCIGSAAETFQELEVKGEVGTERVVALADGRTAIISPPQGDLAGARLTILDHGKATTLPITFAKDAPAEDSEDALSAEQLDQVLRSGTWLEGFEERAPGVLSGWAELSGTLLGIDVRVDGQALHGTFVRDLGSAMVSGRWGLAFTTSRRGFETTNGGKSWMAIDLPDPIDVRKRGASVSRACGPVGCSLAGWIRVGWGATKDAEVVPVPLPPQAGPKPTMPSLSLRCQRVGKVAPPGADSHGSYSISPTYYGSYGYRSSPLITRDWTPLFGGTTPKLGPDDLGWSVEVGSLFDRGFTNPMPMQVGPLLRPYAWGPKGVEWDAHGRFFFRWTSPFESSLNLHTSQQIPIPGYITENTQFTTLGGQPQRPISLWSLVPGDDATHALVIARRSSYGSSNYDSVVVDLEADRPPVEVHTASGLPLPEIDGAVRASGHWYIAGWAADPSTTVVYEIEGGIARELARVPRAAQDSRPAQVRLARRDTGRAIGLVVDGQAAETGIYPAQSGYTRSGDTQWVLPIDIDSGLASEPEQLGPVDLGGKTMDICRGHDSAWIMDMRWPANALNLRIGPGDANVSLGRNAYVRLHVTRMSACVEKLTGNAPYDDDAPAHDTDKPLDGPTIDATLYGRGARQLFRCAAARP